MADPTRFSEALGHDVRSDAWAEQGRSSYVLALDAFIEGRADDAASLARMTVQEAQEAFDLYALWLGELPSLLAAHGVPEHALAPKRLDCRRVKDDLESGWVRYVDLITRFADLAATVDPEAPAVLALARSTWLAAHDPATDQLADLFAVAAEELGEASVGPLWDTLLRRYYETIAEKYHPTIRSWDKSVERLGLDIFEAVRGHLTGPDRDGRFEIREEADRWVLEFAPCGSGGRTYPDSASADGDPRGFTTEEHDWAWRTTGVCLYCVHCCQLQQRAPIERLGFPLRVISPPVRPSEDDPGREVCTWSIYKDRSLIPAHAYSDVGATPPEAAWDLTDEDKRR
ncbi:hypothetical protein [Nocardioides sp.]|uniref:hypothetical protein n=1 Tax=Nocardioides sp. TaxID=35761 RepID=UPI003D13B023